jgi:hypothetical protein
MAPANDTSAWPIAFEQFFNAFLKTEKETSMMDATASGKGLILRRATVVEFDQPDEPDCVCLTVNRRLNSRAQCALVHRRNLGSPFPAVYPTLAQGVREEFYPSCDPSTIDWWGIEVTVDANDRIRFDVKRVSMTITDGVYTGATAIGVDDSQFNDWVGFVEPTVILALKRHIL